MKEYQERIIKEKEELQIKYEKLVDFLLSDIFKNLDTTNKFLLETQLDIMSIYLKILRDRISLFS